MKKILLISILTLSVLTFSGCGKDNAPSNDTNQSVNVQDNQNTDIKAVDALQSAWDLVPEENKFPCFGGNMENTVDNGAGEVPLTDDNMFTNTLLIPADVISKASEAASLMHMMNSNTFTAGAVKLNDMDGAEAANKIKESFKNNQFMCGVPEKIKITTSGNIVVYAYGDAEIVDEFIDKVIEANGTTVVIDENY